MIRINHLRKHAQIAIPKLIQRIDLMTILLLSDLTNADLIPVTNKKQKDHLLGVIWRDELMYGYRKAPAATF